MDKRIQILVVDDHAVVREGIRRILEEEKDLELVGQGANSDEALFQIEMLSPDIVLSDIKMPGRDGIELAREITRRHPSCKIIMLTLYDEYLTEAIDAGARGYPLKDIKREKLAQAIREVYKGEIVIGEGIKSKPAVGIDRSDYPPQPSDLNSMPEEIQLIIPPPVEANQLMRFTSQAEEALMARVLQVVGSWREGTAITMLLSKASTLDDILNKMAQIPDIKTATETLLNSETSPSLLKKAEAIPRLKNRSRKTIFVSLENAAVMV